MKYKVINNVFVKGKLHKAGTTVDIKKDEEKLFKGHIEKITTKKRKKSKSKSKKKSSKKDD